MSHYALDRNNQIYGDYVKRLGIVLGQYQSLAILSESKYDVSLSISLLQSILTIMTENIIYSGRDGFSSLEHAERIEKIEILNKKIDTKSVFGITKLNIVENTFNKSITLSVLLQYMRHAMSHPTRASGNHLVAKTGFYVEQANSIEKVIFVNSPDTKNNNSDYKGTADKFDELKEKQGFPACSILKDRKVYVNGDRFYRVIRIELESLQLIELTKHLSAYVSDFLNHTEDPAAVLKKHFMKFAA